MVDDRPEDNGSMPHSSRPKREAPTIDLEATEVSSETRAAADASATAEASSAPTPDPTTPEPATPESPSASPADAPAARPVSPWIVAPVSGAAAAALVIGVGWMLGWPPVQPASAPATSQLSAAVESISARVAGLEPKVGKPVSDPAAAARTDALEKTVASLRSELTAMHDQAEKLASAVNEVKAAPRGDGSTSPDLSDIDARIAKIESQVRTQGAEIAQQGSRLAEAKVDTKPADDLALRRLVSAALLDMQVRIGEPFAATLAATKALAPNPDELKPLDQFADKGVPNPARLNSELLALMPKLQPAMQSSTTTTGTGIVERLQAGAAKLVKIERTDTVGTDRGAVIARITAAAVRNDFHEARRQLETLEPNDRAAAQAWLERANARDAALAASRKFATDAMAALAKTAN